MKLLSRVRHNWNFDFIDLGTKEGGSIQYCKERFGVRDGIGVDLRKRMVDKAIAKGYTVIHADALEYNPPRKVKFVSMLDFLEHLPNEQVATAMLEKYRDLATDFLFIRHPSFEDYLYLKSEGLKFTWHEWKDHTNRLLVSDYTRIFHQLGLYQYNIQYRMPVTNSSHYQIVPIGAEEDTLKYDKKLHGAKPKLKFPRTLYGQIDIFVALRPFSKSDWQKIVVE